MRKFGSQHRAIFCFVVQFETFDEIFVTALFLVFFDLAEDWQELFQCHGFFTPFLRATHFFDGGVGWVQIQCTENVAKVNCVNNVTAIGIVDGESEFRLCKNKLTYMMSIFSFLFHIQFIFVNPERFSIYKVYCRNYTREYP